MEFKIDELDRKILSIIMYNARIPFKEVAEECGVSRAAVHQRVQRMIDLKVIVGSGYHVDPKKLKFPICTYIGIFLEKGGLYNQVITELDKIPEIVECHYTTGKYGIFAKVYVRDNEHLKEILNDKIHALDGVISTETLISLEQSIRREIPIHGDQ